MKTLSIVVNHISNYEIGRILHEIADMISADQGANLSIPLMDDELKVCCGHVTLFATTQPAIGDLEELSKMLEAMGPGNLGGDLENG